MHAYPCDRWALWVTIKKGWNNSAPWESWENFTQPRCFTHFFVKAAFFLKGPITLFTPIGLGGPQFVGNRIGLFFGRKQDFCFRKIAEGFWICNMLRLLLCCSLSTRGPSRVRKWETWEGIVAPLHLSHLKGVSAKVSEDCLSTRWFSRCDQTSSPYLRGHLTNPLSSGHVNSPSPKRSRIFHHQEVCLPGIYVRIEYLFAGAIRYLASCHWILGQFTPAPTSIHVTWRGGWFAKGAVQSQLNPPVN